MMKINNTMPGVYTAGSLPVHLCLAYSGREFPNAKRSDFFRQVGIDYGDLAWVRQVHGANVVEVSESAKPTGDCNADGMITEHRGMALAVYTADCIPLYFWDSEREVIGIAHAGWRGIYYHLPSKMVKALRHNYAVKKDNLNVLLGPGIRSCCYDVGEEFKDYFPEYFTPVTRSDIEKDAIAKGKMDLIAAITDELKNEGVPAINIHDTGICTACQADKFFSFRRENKTAERMISVIQYRSET